MSEALSQNNGNACDLTQVHLQEVQFMLDSLVRSTAGEGSM